MVEQEYGEQKLEPEFTQRVVEEAMERGREYFKTRKWDDAVHEFSQAARMDPHRVDAHHWLGRAYAVRAYRGTEGLTKRDTPCEESLDAAIDQYKRAIELDPDYGPSHAHLANLYLLHKGMVDEAVVEYRKAAEFGGMDTEVEHAVYNNLGHVYRNKGLYEEALKWFDKAVSLDPSVSYVPWGTATVYAVQGKAEEAVKFLKQAVELGENPRRLDETNELFDNIRNSKEFREFVQTIEHARDEKE